MSLLLLLVLLQDAAEKLAEFRKAERDTSAALVSALESLAELRDPKILKELGRHLKGQPADVKIAAARLIGAYDGNKEAADKLSLVLAPEASQASRDEAGNDQGHEVGVALLRALGEVGHPRPRSKIHALFTHRNFSLAQAAVEASAKIGSLDSVEPLITLLIEIERQRKLAEAPRQTYQAPPGSVPGLTKMPGSKPKPPPPLSRERQDAILREIQLRPAVQEALKLLTEDGIERTGEAWSKWWSKRKRELRKKRKETE